MVMYYHVHLWRILYGVTRYLRIIPKFDYIFFRFIQIIDIKVSLLPPEIVLTYSEGASRKYIKVFLCRGHEKPAVAVFVSCRLGV